MCVFPVQEKYLGRECRAISAAKEIMPGPPDFLVERRGFEPVTLGTAGISAHLTVVLLPTAHGVLLSCASAAVRRYRRTPRRRRRSAATQRRWPSPVHNVDDQLWLQYFRACSRNRSRPALRQQPSLNSWMFMSPRKCLDVGSDEVRFAEVVERLGGRVDLVVVFCAWKADEDGALRRADG